jgi:RNA polymerase sigma-70 factor (ECF subfamily)
MDTAHVVQAQQGDRQAFESLTVAHHSRLFKVAYGILRDRHLAQDATQQAFFEIWRNLRRLNDPSKFEGWSYRLLVRACYAEAKRTPGWVSDGEMQPKDEPRARDAFGAVAERDLLERGFQHLSPEHRAVIVLRYLLDMTPEQIADTLDIPRKTVYSRLKRAILAMRAAVEADARPERAASVPQEIAR